MVLARINDVKKLQEEAKVWVYTQDMKGNKSMT